MARKLGDLARQFLAQDVLRADIDREAQRLVVAAQAPRRNTGSVPAMPAARRCR